MRRKPSQPAGFGFQIHATDGLARAGILQTAHGPIETPAFMTAATAGTVKAMTPDAVRSTGSQCVVANTYHLMLRPGADQISAQGGLHRLMDWPGPILTDSRHQYGSPKQIRRDDHHGLGRMHRLSSHL
jgi:queuine tRNA-ribosyltransferase